MTKIANTAVLNFFAASKQKALLTMLLALSFMASYANNSTSAARKNGSVAGTVIDAQTNEPVEFATIALYKQPDNKLAGGCITDMDGKFSLKDIEHGEYRVDIAFVGYKTKNININLTDANPNSNLGKILLKQNAQELGEVNVVADKAAVDYKIDRKVVNVSQQLNAISGTAVDVLENIPSIRVDVDGGVSLRGSSSFTVLIDGRPTPLDASDALAQMPASAIENIEIITNPSAKYEPDGASGIINIITKKNALSGLTGVVNGIVGYPGRLGTDFTLDYRHKKWHLFGGANIRNGKNLNESEGYRWLSDSITTNYTESNGESTRKRKNWGVNGGADYSFTERTNLGFNVRFGSFTNNNNNTRDYLKYTNFGDSSQYKNVALSDNNGKFQSLNIFYKQTFEDNKEHILEAQVSVNNNHRESISDTETKTSTDQITEGIENETLSDGQGVRFKIDYVHPTIGTQKLSLGAQGRISPSDQDFIVNYYDTTTNGYVFQPNYSYETEYLRQTYSVYAIYDGEWGQFGYQLGLRGEYTYQDLKLSNGNGNYHFEDPAVFPTIHLSYNANSDLQMMAGYTRRINRPRPFQLSPNLTWEDAYNVRQGNPEIAPEYINSFDLSMQKKLGTNFISLDAYCRITENTIERVRQVYSNDVILHTIANVGTDYAIGLEGTINYSIGKIYQVNLMGNMYQYQKKGELLGQDFSQSSFNWNMRLNNVFKFPTNTKVQMDFDYFSKTVTSQGTNGGFFSASVAVRQEMLDRRLSATLQMRNALGTMKFENTTSGTGFYTSNTFKPSWPQFNLTISFKINNFKLNFDDEDDSNRSHMQNGSGEGGGESGGGDE